MINVSKCRHRFSGCTCGHHEHIGRADLRDRNGWFVICPECEDMAEREHVIVAIDTLARIELLSILPGVTVRYDGQTCHVVRTDEITKLNGMYPTGYAFVKLREAAA